MSMAEGREDALWAEALAALCALKAGGGPGQVTELGFFCST